MDRRTAIAAGFGAIAAAAFARRGLGAMVPLDGGPPPPPPVPGDPLLRLASLGPSESVGALPTAPTWFGDVFVPGTLPFHQCETCDGADPPVTEHVDVAIVGGGLAGLAAAHALRERSTVLFELRTRLGGNAMGESWRTLRWSLGSAYFMAPEPGSSLDRLYRRIGVDRQVRVDDSSATFSWKGDVTTDLLGPNATKEEREGLARYLAALRRYSEREYPDIPFDGAPGASVAALDDLTFRDHVQSTCGTVPPRLAYALQAYCASSFGVGSDELNAAAGWNFVAAEETGRWVLPGGNAGLARALWKAATEPGSGHGHHHPPHGVDVRVDALVGALERADGGAVLRWRAADGSVRRMHARHVVCAGPKHTLPHLIPWLSAADEAKHDAIRQVHTVPYLVGNVILSRPIPHDLYDLFVAGSTAFPMDANAFGAQPVITDMVNGSFALEGHGPCAALTLYWPLPWHTARFEVVAPDAWRTWAGRAAEQLAALLPLIGRTMDDVLQVRWARWGHAMPVAPPGWYGSGAPQLLRRPLEGCIWFANQDNWLLPAVETSLLEGLDVAARIDEALG